MRRFVGPDPRCVRRAFVLVLFALTAAGRGQPPGDPERKTLPPGAERRLAEADRLDEDVARLQDEGRYDEAIRKVRQALEIRRAVVGERHPDVATSLNTLASLVYAQGRAHEALPLLEEALAINEARLGPRHRATAAAQNSLAGLLVALGRFERARLLYQRAVDITRAELGEDDPATATALSNLGGVCADLGDYAAARPLYERALAIRRKGLGARHPSTASSLNNLASVLTTMGDTAAARRLYEEALAALRTVRGDRHPDTAAALNNLAVLLESEGNYNEARPLYEQALAIRRAALGERHPDVARSLRNLARVLEGEGDHAAARAFYERALEIQRQAFGERHPEVLRTSNDLAALLHQTGDDRGARLYYERTLKNCREVLGDVHPATAQIRHNLAVFLNAQGDFDGAEALMRQVVEVRRKVYGPDHPDTARALETLAVVLLDKGAPEAAQPLSEQALAVTRKALGEDHPDTASSMITLARVSRARGDSASARGLFEQALAVQEKVLGERHPAVAEAVEGLADLALERGASDEARALAERALAIRKDALGDRHPQTARSRKRLGFVLWARGDLAGAARLTEEALTAAEANLYLAADGQSERQQSAMVRSLRGHLDQFLSLAHAASYRPEASYGHVLRWKGALFARQRRSNQGRRAAGADREVARLITEYEATARRLANLALGNPGPRGGDRDRQVAALAERKEQLEAELSRASRLYQGFRAAESGDPWLRVLAALPADTVLVDYLEYTDARPSPDGARALPPGRRLLAFVASPEHRLACRDLGPVEPIAEAVAAWRRRLALRDHPPDADGSGTALRRLVWDPLEADLVRYRTVLVSPDGPLGAVPLAALPGKGQGRLLLDDVAVAYIPAFRELPSVLARVDRDRDRPPSLLVLGDVDYGEADPGPRPGKTTRDDLPVRFHALPGTEVEIASVARVFRRTVADGRLDELSGRDATEESFSRLAPGHRYLHLATAGFFATRGVPSRPRSGSLDDEWVIGQHPGLLTGLALAGANRPPEPGAPDGLLTGLEVAALDLDGVELVVLSACETALGQRVEGEGLFGLQRAFQVAGARSVVAALGNVWDAQTSPLMSRFYENLWVHKMSKLEALRQAQLAIIRGPRPPGAGTGDLPPEAWATFVLSGDWR
jgi:CHAT domain-containing protein/tetratricopeptide (TPR) repeat protein